MVIMEFWKLSSCIKGYLQPSVRSMIKLFMRIVKFLPASKDAYRVGRYSKDQGDLSWMKEVFKTLELLIHQNFRVYQR